MPGPFTIDEAREYGREASRNQQDAEDRLFAANRDYALAEEAYRKALAAETWRLREQDKVAWTACPDLARGADEVARLKRIRDEREGDRTIAQHAVYRMSADRKDMERLIEWSMRRELAEGYRDPVEPVAQTAGQAPGPSTFAGHRLREAAA